MMETKSLTAKGLHQYQKNDIQTIFDCLNDSDFNNRILYQLPTGGGKTVVFSEIVRRFITQFDKKVMVLTHRKELSRQTATTLQRLGINNGTIKSSSRNFKLDNDCYVAMVETLRNRIKSGKIDIQDVGLLIIDEAHHNSFRKLLKRFKNARIIGVTATPFSSDISKPMKKHYQKLIIGENISGLIEKGFLASPESHVYEVELNTLKTGKQGDYTVTSSNELYGSPAMLELLVSAYREKAEGKKTLIFNNGIDTSLKVRDIFDTHGIPIRHLDNKTAGAERTAILTWFKKTKGAVLTSVSILTTGFDEPTIQAVILNRATTSITLYHQMIGRGARRLPSKKSFQIIDLGNNIERFGEWQLPVDWQFVFEQPEAFAQQLQMHSGGNSAVQSHALSAELRAKFPNTLEMTFDIEGHFEETLENNRKPKTVISQSIRQHALMCLENSESVSQAIELANALHPEIDWRVKQYVKCIDKASKNYKDWLIESYEGKLHTMIKKLHARMLQPV